MPDTNRQGVEDTRWKNLLSWLRTKGLSETVPVELRVREGAGRGLYTKGSIALSTPFVRIPKSALLNSRTLRSIYPDVNLEGYERKSKDKLVLNGTQLLSIHLCLNRPHESGESKDVNFGPYITTLPREFNNHPLTWLVKKEQNLATTCETALLDVCPPGVLLELENVAKRFRKDWEIALRSKTDYPKIFCDEQQVENLTLMNFLWAWLNVNTRCLYLRVFSKHLPLSNLTLCPIIDFANHSSSSTYPQMRPEKVATDIWTDHSNPVVRPHDFVFISPDRQMGCGEELFLKYGSHSSRTLFTEYGFVDESADASGGEVEVSDCLDGILNGKRAEDHIRRLLDEEGYSTNWHLYSSPAPAHPSWRFLVALRLINLDLSGAATSDEISNKMRDWRAVAMGETEVISDANEAAVRKDLNALCEFLVTRAEKGMEALAIQCSGDALVQNTRCGHCSWTKGNIRRLWEEEQRVAQEVLASLAKGSDF